ncbi:polysaccharide biosynthesis tyrosine autokinase [Mycobacterium sp. MS1601]|uniref:polysaccharide biosynthesis tyrosine autokinase n=1 Tax=Mycobacterium sp. MS1601 TaxID=1936029 RepID=UPI00178CFCDB|nr:polysaccharide biosynthesis tyrosine autokinase [Mycobacterium sp. MS1601]
MTVHDFAQILRTRWKSICAITAVAILGALAYSFVITPQYEATTRLFVATTSDGTNSETYDGGLFAERRVLSYTELLMGEIIAQRTIDKLGLDMSAADLQDEIEASVPADTVLIDVTVTDASATRARDIANTMADEFVVMAAELETPELGATPNARVIVQQRAEIPDSPVNAAATRNLAIAAVMGLLAGVVVAFVRDRLDDSVRDAAGLEKATGVGLLADVPFTTDQGATSDAYRDLRINLGFLEVTDGPRVLVITSCVPGEGRTTVAVNLARSLAEAGHSVVLVDADLRRPSVASVLGLGGQRGLSAVLTGEAQLDEALEKTSGLHVLSAGAVPPNPTDLIESRTAADVLKELSGQFDYVVVDSPSLLVADAALLASRAAGVVLVARFGRTTRKQIGDAVHRLKRAGAPLLGGVLAMTPPKKRPQAHGS